MSAGRPPGDARPGDPRTPGAPSGRGQPREHPRELRDALKDHARETPGERRVLGRVEETSAGGLVLDRAAPDARGALIGRLDRRGRLLWSLPKGHVEVGETTEDTAVREVQEETGIRGRVLGPLGTIDFWFVADGRRVHKTVHHFLLLATGGPHGLELSDADVEVTEVAWVPLDEVCERLAYADERRLLDKVPGLLADTA